MNRYERQIALPTFGPRGQQAVASAHVLIVGAGGLGSPALLYLAAAGVGHISLVDADRVDPTNLHRQVVHTTAAVGEEKVLSAARTARNLNPDIHITPLSTRLTADNARDLLRGVDVVVDGSDNFATRHVVSWACAQAGIPHAWASILGTDAQMSVFWAEHGPIYEDLYPTPPPPGTVPSCAQAGVLGTVVGVAGTALAHETLKLLSRTGTPLVGEIGYFAGDTGHWEYIPLQANPDTLARVLAHPPAATATITPERLDTERDSSHPPVLIDVREPQETAAVSPLPGAHLWPLATLPGHLTDIHTQLSLDSTARVVVYCASGVRSAEAAQWLQANGLPAASLAGGIQAWLAAQ